MQPHHQLDIAAPGPTLGLYDPTGEPSARISSRQSFQQRPEAIQADLTWDDESDEIPW